MPKSYKYESGTINLNFLKENSYSLIDLSDCPQVIFCNSSHHGLDAETLILPKNIKVLNPDILSHSIIQKIIFPEKIRHLAEGCLSDVYGLKEVDFTNYKFKSYKRKSIFKLSRPWKSYFKPKR